MCGVDAYLAVVNAYLAVSVSSARSDILSATKDMRVSGSKHTRDGAGMLTEPESDVDVHRNPKDIKDERARDVEVRTFESGSLSIQGQEGGL